MQRIFFAFFLFSTTSLFAQQSPGTIRSFEVEGNQVIFSCENNARVLLQFCSRSVVKVWYEPTGVFHRENESFAVINEKLEDISIHVESSEQAYEVFTDFLRVRVEKSPFSLQIFDKYQKLLVGDYREGHSAGAEGYAVKKVLRSDENFFGLGEKTGSLNRRGRKFTMWNSDKPCYSVSEDPLYKSIPFFLSSYGYGIFFDNTHKTEFDFGVQSSEFFSFSAPAGEMVYYVIQGNSYKQVIENYTRLTGRPIMPPRWAFGFSQSRGLLTNEKLTREIAQGFRDRKIPCDIIFQDIGWTQYLQDFNWRKGNYENPQGMIADLSRQGFKVVVSQDPVVSRANTSQWTAADSLGYFAKDIRTGKSYDMPWPWGGNCGVVDFTNPAVGDWWGALQQQPIDDGVEGFWTDMGEPAWSNLESPDRLNMKHQAGMHGEIHNVYGFTWDRVVTEQFEKRNPNRRIFQMTRAGYSGMQRYTFGWSGDSGNGSNVLDGWSRLENQIPVGLSAGMGLIPFWSCDISGYCGDIKDYRELTELYVRWLQFGVFNPISRAHHEGNNAVEPWLFGPEAERIAKSSIEQKYRLFPYLYTYGREAYDTGLPLMRAMFLEYPEDPECLKAESQFLVGQELLVAPVVKRGAETKDIYLPEGEWISLDRSSRFKGGQWISLPVTLETLPVFVRAGSIIPTVPVMQYIGEVSQPQVIFRVFPRQSGKATFELYEDDGITNDYQKDISSRTRVTSETGKEVTKLTIEARQANGHQPKPRNFYFEVPANTKPRGVSINETRVKSSKFVGLPATNDSFVDSPTWSYDADSKVVLVRVPDKGMRGEIRIEH